MLNKARKKFIIWAMVAMTAVVAILIAVINIVNWNYSDVRLDAALNEIVEMHDQRFNAQKPDKKNDGAAADDLPDEQEPEYEKLQQKPGTGLEDGHERKSAWNQYAGRISMLILTDADELGEIIQDHELMADETAEKLTAAAVKNGRTEGYYDGFKYKMVRDENLNTNIIYALDCSTNIETLRSTVWISVLVGVFCLILALLFILKMSRIAVEPVKVSIEKQKEFITNAGHELKTPLSAIATNMDILSMDLEENEWVEGTKRQVRKLRKLVESLVSLSKMEEEENMPELQSFNLSRLAGECIDGFAGVAEVSGKILQMEIADDIQAYGDVSITQQLIGILCDNAIKYSAGSEPIILKVFSDGKKACFQTVNDWEKNVDPDKLDSLFERFYRGDPSRVKEERSGGYGLGLSIASAMAEKNHGTIKVNTDSQGRIVFTASFLTA